MSRTRAPPSPGNTVAAGPPPDGAHLRLHRRACRSCCSCCSSPPGPRSGRFQRRRSAHRAATAPPRAGHRDPAAPAHPAFVPRGEAAKRVGRQRGALGTTGTRRRPGHPVQPRLGLLGGLRPGRWGLRSARGWQQRGEPEEASTTPVTFTNQLSLSKAGKQIPAPSRKQGQEAQSGRDTFIMFLGAAPLHFAGDKVTSLQPEQRRGGRFIQSDGNKKLQPTPRGLLTAQGSTCHRSDSRPAFARATCKTSSQPHTGRLGPGPGVGAASALPPGKGGHETQINTASEGPSQPHCHLAWQRHLQEEICQPESNNRGDVARRGQGWFVRVLISSTRLSLGTLTYTEGAQSCFDTTQAA